MTLTIAEGNNTTSVQVDFYAANSSSKSNNVNAILIDRRNHLILNVISCCDDISKFVGAQVVIDHHSGSKAPTMQSFPLRLGQNYIGKSGTVRPSDIVYDDFENGEYAIKIKVLMKEDGSSISSLFSKYSYGNNNNDSHYKFLFRDDGGDKFGDNSEVVNVNDIKTGSNIDFHCPITHSLGHDTRKPKYILFTFDEIDDYENKKSENTEQLSSYSILKHFHDSGSYTLENNQLINDSIYLVNITGIYNDGHTVSKTLEKEIYVISPPVIHNVITYNSLNDDDDDATTSSVMNVFLTEQTAAVQITTDNRVTFQLLQGQTIYYQAVVQKIITAIDGLVNYTILKTDVTTIQNATPPSRETDGSYKFNVVVTLNYMNVSSNESTIIKTSEPYQAVFIHDVNQLPPSIISNPWVAAAVTTKEGVRSVDMTDSISKKGYVAAPDFGIVGRFSKHDFYGTGITTGIFKDLDRVDENGVPLIKHQFTVSINNSNEVPVKYLYQIQGSSETTATVQKDYLELMERRDCVYELNGVEKVLNETDLNLFKGSSDKIITYSKSGNEEDGWLVKNTGPNTNGALPKVNFYFYAYLPTHPPQPQSSTNSFTFSQSSGIGMYAVFYQIAGAKEYPFFNVYTASNSKIMYSNDEGNTLVPSNSGKVGLTLAFTGDDDPSLFPEIPSQRRVKFVKNTLYSELPTPDNSGSEYVKYLTLQTSSNALTSSDGSFNFRLLETGIVTINTNFKKINVRYNQPKPRILYSDDGSFPNIPGAAGVKGTEQPDIYFHIPYSANLFKQQDSVVVSIKIIAPPGETTVAQATPSNEQVVVHKVKTYTMSNGDDSEPTISGSGSNSVLKVPINNPTSDDGDFYFSSATFKSDDLNPSSVITNKSNGGVFDIIINNPSKRGIDNPVNYSIYYTIDDPNVSGSPINGPESEQYSIFLTDNAISNNITISNYSYKTYNNDGVSSFTFDVNFQEYQDTSVDGLNVYFESDNIERTIVKKLSRYNDSGTEMNTQQNVLVTLQDTSDANSLKDGINIQDRNGNETLKWMDFTHAKISFFPYSTSKTNTGNSGAEFESEDSVDKYIYHIPVISLVEDVALTGGVIESESSSPTKMTWKNNLVDLYSNVSDSVDSSYELTLNNVDVSSAINSNKSSYNVDISGPISKYTLVIKVKISTKYTNRDDDDGEVVLYYYSEPVTLEFDSMSVDQSNVNIEIKRGSNDKVLRTTYNNFLVNGASFTWSTFFMLSVQSVQLVNASNPSSPNLLSYTSTINGEESGTTQNLIQEASTEFITYIHVYDISNNPVGDNLVLNYRVKAGVMYTVTGTTYPIASTGLYLIMPTGKRYTVAGRPMLTIKPEYRVVNTGDYSGRIAVDLSINANGLKVEGIQSLAFIVGQESDHTDHNDSGNGEGKQVLLSFSSSQAVLPTYTIQGVATTTSLTDNVAVGETLTLIVDDVQGFNEGSGTSGTWALVVGNLTANDQSVLYFPTASGFINTVNMAVIGVVATRLGIRIAVKDVRAAS